MAWKVELSATAERELNKLDPQQSKRILKFLRERIAKLDDPRSIGKALQGSRLGEILEVSAGRLLAHLQDRRRAPAGAGSSC